MEIKSNEFFLFDLNFFFFHFCSLFKFSFKNFNVILFLVCCNLYLCSGQSYRSFMPVTSKFNCKHCTLNASVSIHKSSYNNLTIIMNVGGLNYKMVT